MREQLLRDIEVNLNKKTIFDVRQIARALNVHSEYPQKPKIIEAILSYAEGVSEPQPPSQRGAPPKSDVYDERLVLQIEQCRAVFKSDAQPESVLTVNDPSSEKNSVKGVLENVDGSWFLLTPSGEVFVADTFVTRYSLVAGDEISGSCVRKNGAKPAIIVIDKVNGSAPDTAVSGRNFSALTHVYPEKRIVLGGDAACRMIDMFAPQALGQRTFISASGNGGKTTLIKNIANSIAENHPEISVIVLLLNARPEEVTDFKRSLGGASLYASAFDVPHPYQTRVAEAVFSHARRLVELGKDAVVLADGLLSSFVSGQALRKYLYSALNADEGGSLTVIASVDETSPDFAALVPTANSVIKLSPELAARRVYPAIDAVKSYTGREETLLNSDELSAANAIRRTLSAEDTVKLFKNTSDNTEIITRYENG